MRKIRIQQYNMSLLTMSYHRRFMGHTSSNFLAFPVTKVSGAVEKAAIVLKAKAGRPCSAATERNERRIVQG
jgi:hypothetical protein